MKQKLLIRRILVSALSAVVIVWLGYWLMGVLGGRETPVRQMSFREASKQVQVEPIVYKSREIALSGLGKVVSESAIDVLTEVQGEILPGSVALKRGQAFRKGQLLFRINDKEARLNLYAQKSNFMTSVAGIMPDLRIDYPNAFSKWEAYFASVSVDERLPDLPAATTPQEKVFLTTRNIYNLFYGIQSAEERLRKYRIRAPFSGSFVDVFQEVNSVVNPGSRVARIARSNRLELEVPFRPEDLPLVKKGMTVDVVSENGETQWPGRINRIGSALDPTTQSINLYIAFNPGNAQVFEGQLLEAKIPGSKVRDVMEIPRDAVFNRNQIYLVKDSSRLQVVDIDIELVNEEMLLFSGVKAGEMIVVEPLFNAYENMPVRINSEVTE
ncbi:MAG: efflux RND transporter periplasmic adaptor subunit [Bacteroidota bacterium]